MTVSVCSQLPEAIATVADRIAALLRACPDPAVPIPGAEWTVGEAAAHLVLANELMADVAAGHARAYGDGTPGSLAAANAASLEAFTERTPGVLAEGIVRHARAFTAAAEQHSPSEGVVTPLGPMDLATFGSYLLTHMLGHGYDIAVALRRPHMIERDFAGMTLPFLRLAMPRVLSARATSHNACYELRLLGAARGSSFAVSFADGALTVTPEPPRRPDCTIAMEPVTFLLVALGRRTAAGAMVRGKVLAWGRKPWLAPGFPELFTAP
jgi:uncharacterized protein (TIGR03083 family)